MHSFCSSSSSSASCTAALLFFFGFSTIPAHLPAFCPASPCFLSLCLPLSPVLPLHYFLSFPSRFLLLFFLSILLLSILLLFLLLVCTARSTKKTLTRWKADWEQASRFYREATKAYKLSGPSGESCLLSALRESAVAHENTNDYHTAGAEAEAAAAIATKLAQPQLSYTLYREASVSYRKHASAGAMSKGPAMLVKAAEAIENTDIQLAISALRDACALFINDESQVMFHDATYKKTIQFLVKHNKYTDAIEILKQQIPIASRQLRTFNADICKNILSIVVLHFALFQYELGKKVVEEYEMNDCFAASNECIAAISMVEAWEEGDNNKLVSALKLSPFRFVNNSVAVVARGLTFDRSVELAGIQRQLERKHAMELAADGSEAEEEGEEEEEEEVDEKGMKKTAAQKYAEEEEREAAKAMQRMALEKKSSSKVQAARAKAEAAAAAAAEAAAEAEAAEREEEEEGEDETEEEQQQQRAKAKVVRKKKQKKVAEEDEEEEGSDPAADASPVGRPKEVLEVATVVRKSSKKKSAAAAADAVASSPVSPTSDSSSETDTAVPVAVKKKTKAKKKAAIVEAEEEEEGEEGHITTEQEVGQPWQRQTGKEEGQEEESVHSAAAASKASAAPRSRAKSPPSSGTGGVGAGAGGAEKKPKKKSKAAVQEAEEDEEEQNECMRPAPPTRVELARPMQVEAEEQEEEEQEVKPKPKVKAKTKGKAKKTMEEDLDLC